jgi:hypothetical protein
MQIEILKKNISDFLSYIYTTTARSWSKLEGGLQYRPDDATLLISAASFIRASKVVQRQAGTGRSTAHAAPKVMTPFQKYYSNDDKHIASSCSQGLHK